MIRLQSVDPRALVGALALPAAPAASPAANYVAAQSEMNTLANAMELVYLDTGWLTTLENLNDVNNPNVGNDFDYILDGGGALVINPTTGQFRPQRLDIVSIPGFNGWQGPYVNYQNNRIDLPPVEYDLGSPLDPWGNPYRLYTPLGLADPISESITLEDYGDTFDRFMIVSYGPDGVPSDLDPPPRQIGGFTIQGQVISSVRLSPIPERRAQGYEVRIKGYGFGVEQGTGGVFVNSEPMTVESWTASLVTATVEELPPPEAAFELLSDGASVPSTFDGFLLEEAETSVEEWTLY